MWVWVLLSVFPKVIGSLKKKALYIKKSKNLKQFKNITPLRLQEGTFNDSAFASVKFLIFVNNYSNSAP